MKITKIVDGYTKIHREKGYWGISFAVNRDILFDTFCSSRALLNNMRRKRIKPGEIRHVVISHDHWDHTGSLWGILDKGYRPDVYICRSSSPGLIRKIRKYGIKPVLVGRKPVRITAGVMATGQV